MQRRGSYDELYRPQVHQEIGDERTLRDFLKTVCILCLTDDFEYWSNFHNGSYVGSRDGAAELSAKCIKREMA